MPALLSSFAAPVIISLAALAALFVALGPAALLTAALLIVLEVTLSFDNAVINARVLKRMSPQWQGAFLTWGILIAVVVTRLVLPVLIVSASALTSPLAIATLAFADPTQYSALLHAARFSIYSFGAVFLLMVSLKYFLDSTKKVHWIEAIERHLTLWGRIEAVEIALALAVAIAVALFVPSGETVPVLLAGITGVVLFILIQGITEALELEVGGIAVGGLALFLYLNVLDSAFSIDSVVGAFALTDSIPVIAVGLGIGAYFVRSLTLFMVRRKTLDNLVFLEHGAHWAIFGLSASMFANLFIEVPEIVTGTIGLMFLVAAYYSSLRFQSRPTPVTK